MRIKSEFGGAFKEAFINEIMGNLSHEHEAVKAYLIRGLNPCLTCADLYYMLPTEVHRFFVSDIQEYIDKFGSEVTVPERKLIKYKQDKGHQILMECLMVKMVEE